MKIYLATLLLFLGITLVSAQDTEENPVAQLAKVKYFAFGGTGPGGIISDGEKLYNQILKSSTAQSDFITILNTGNAPSKCYALAGLQSLDPKQFEMLSVYYSKDETKVTTMMGCFQLGSSISSILRGIKNGLYQPPPKKP